MPCRASKLLVQVGVLESSSYANHTSFSSDLPKPRRLACRRVLTEYLPLSLFSFLTHRHFIVSTKYLPEFYTSSLHITSELSRADQYSPAGRNPCSASRASAHLY